MSNTIELIRIIAHLRFKSLYHVLKLKNIDYWILLWVNQEQIYCYSFYVFIISHYPCYIFLLNVFFVI